MPSFRGKERFIEQVEKSYRMALIECPECHKEISDAAMSCPDCGKPMSRSLLPGKTFFFVTAILIFGIFALSAIAFCFFSRGLIHRFRASVRGVGENLLKHV